MKKAICLIFLLFSVIFLHAQSGKEVDSIVKLYPKHFSSTEKLAQQIQNDFSTEFGKARAIYSWLAFNIRYDVNAFLHPKPNKKFTYKTEEERQIKIKQIIDKRIGKALSKRKGVCQEYADLFNQIALEVGLESQVNLGDAKTKNYDIGRRRIKVSHAWNSVKIDGTWRLIDATWGAGYVNLKKEKFYHNFNTLYFDMPPKLFFKEHYPAKGFWFDTVIDKTEFLKEPLINNDILNGKYEIIEPQNGVIEVCPNDSVTFKIRNVSIDSEIQYSLKNKNETEKFATKIQNEEGVEFKILIDRKIARYLTIYIDGKAIATFKVSRYRN